MSKVEMKPWPDKDDYKTELESGKKVWMGDDECQYERARARAAIERLKIAVEHINHAPRCAMMQPVGKMACDCGYHEALALIGEMP